MKTLGFAMCGSFCTLSQAMEQMEALRSQYDITPIFSTTAYETDTRFGTAESFRKKSEQLCGKPPLHTIVETEPIGPKHMVDVLAVCPCTGNTLSKIANGITDTPVTMAVKSALRIGIPVVLCTASNDSLGASGQNIMRLMNTKNIYFVPFAQDDPVKKPLSLVAQFPLLAQTVELALQGRQLQPVFLG